jgi:hypothetical protein
MKSFSELTGIEKTFEILRWICVPVAAVLGVVALGMMVRVVMPPSLAQLPGTPVAPPSEFRRFVLPPISRAVMAATFVTAGAMMAPRRRFTPAIVLAVLWILYSFGYDVLVHHGGGIKYYANFAVSATTALGAAYIFYSAKSKGGPE